MDKAEGGLTKWRIPIFKLEFDAEYRRAFQAGCERIFDEGHLTNHSFARELEKKFSDFVGSGTAVSVGNGSAAIEVALRAVDVQGKDVLLPTNTFIATAVAALNAGATPVALDVEGQYFGLSAAAVERALTPRTGAVVCVHIGGIVSPEVEKIAALCRARGVALVEDCAHAHGASLNGVKAGCFGAAGAFSFHMTKVMTTGEGGVVLFHDARLAEEARSIRQFGADSSNPLSHVRDGGNFKMTEFQALAGVLELEKRAVSRIAKRQALAKRYQERLSGSRWRTLTPPPGGISPYYKQVVLPPVPRAAVEAHFEKHGIALTGGVYYLPLHRQPVFADKFNAGDFPVADSFADRHICPPCYPELTVEEVDYICDALLALEN